MSYKILCVDDEPNVLEAYRRGLRKQFEIETATGGPEGLELIKGGGAFAVVVSDMRMPGMDGVEFLTAVKQADPRCVRMMLTGNSDQETAIKAVNEGSIFRFLTKPCPPESLARALHAGIEQHRLIIAEKELLQGTLRGAVKVLCDVLSLANPTAFGHAARVRKTVGDLCRQMDVQPSWECEIAAVLSQIGCVTIPPETLEKHYRGETLTESETDMIRSHPGIGCQLVSNIPRLEGVAKIIAYQQKGFDGSGGPKDNVGGESIPLGARVLRVALDYDATRWRGRDDRGALGELDQRVGKYDPEILDALRDLIGIEPPAPEVEIALDKLTPGMLLAADVRTSDGMVVVAKGQEVTPALFQRIRNFARHRTIDEPLRVFSAAAAETCATTR